MERCPAVNVNWSACSKKNWDELEEAECSVPAAPIDVPIKDKSQPFDVECSDVYS